MLKKFYNGVLDFILPPVCLHCESLLPDGRKYLCEKCTESIARIDNKSNPDLQRINSNDNVSNSYSLFLFVEGTAIQSLIHHLKYGQMRKIGREYGKKLAEEVLKRENLNADFIVPVPLHISKKRERGYNQSDFICEGIGDVLNVPLLNKGLKRMKFTKTQTKLTREERQENVRGAFAVRKKYIQTIKDKNIILVDDVITTGSTILECSKVLKNAGCGDVYVCSLALAE
ncbi:MAG: ComF family protein [Ignavibacteria bacterium]